MVKLDYKLIWLQGINNLIYSQHHLLGKMSNLPDGSAPAFEPGWMAFSLHIWDVWRTEARMERHETGANGAITASRL